MNVTVARGDLARVAANASVHLEHWGVGGEDRAALDRIDAALEPSTALAVPAQDPAPTEEGAYVAGLTAGFRAAYAAVLERSAATETADEAILECAADHGIAEEALQ